MTFFRTMTKYGVALSVAFGAGSYLLSDLAASAPALIEQWYSRGLYQAVRWGFDHTLGLLPVPAFYVFWAAVGVWWGRRWYLRPKHQQLAYWLGTLVVFSGVTWGAFYWLWGYNYRRVPLVEQMGIELVPIVTAALWKELNYETKVLDSLRTLLKGADTMAINDDRFWPKQAEDTVRQSVVRFLEEQGYPSAARVRGRKIFPAGLLEGFNAAGLYWPFVGEGNIDAGLHPLQQLPVMAHEMAHGYGFGDEGTCNFIAYLAGVQSGNLYFAYCSHLSYWRTLAPHCYRSDSVRYNTTFRPFLPAGIRQDVRAVVAQSDRYAAFFPQFSYLFYDQYLRSQGVQSGMASYNEVIQMVYSWRKY